VNQPIHANGPAMLQLAAALERHESGLAGTGSWTAENCGSPAAAAAIRQAGTEARDALAQFGTEFAELGMDIRLAARDYAWQDSAEAQAFAHRNGTGIW
jgi:hypothetical protein